MNKLVRVMAPTLLPVTLAEAKAHLRITHDEEDALVARLIGTATSYFDGYAGVLGRCILQQSWTLYRDAFPSGAITIPLGQLIAVTGFDYTSTAGTNVAISATDYVVDLYAGQVLPVSTWPDTSDVPNAVRLTYTAGYGDEIRDVPDAIRHAILLLVGHWYENREAVAVGATPAEVPMAVDALIAPFRIMSL
jgi:uncharacterized phiE125 gp8 family phage protein